MQPKPPLDKPSDTLPSDVKELQAIVRELRDQVAYFKRMLFGRRSEKSEDNPNQGLLFGSVETQDEAEDGSEEEEQEEEASSRKRRRRRHRGRVPLPDHLPRHTHEIHPPDAECTCSCCETAKKIIGQEVTEELEVIPAKFFVNRYVRYKYACPNGCDGEIRIGPLPPRPIEKGIPGPGFLAHLITSKYADHLPLYRQQQIYRRYGLEIPRSTMCGWVAYAAFLLSPIVTAMKSCVLASRKIHTDDTPITVLDPTVKPVGSRKGYMWVYVGDHDDVVFAYTDSRKRDGPASFLAGYRGYLQADAFSGYDRIYAEQEVLEVACWAHARRKFFDAQNTGGAEAVHIVQLIGGLYAIERKVLGLGLAIRSSSGLPADILGLADRGYLRKGAFADVVVFDPKRFRDKATFTDPHQHSEGCVWVFVNGVAAIKNGKTTGSMSGRVVRHPKKAPKKAR